MTKKLARRLERLEAVAQTRPEIRGKDAALYALLLAWARSGDYDAIPTPKEEARGMAYVEEWRAVGCSPSAYDALREMDFEQAQRAKELFYRFLDALFQRRGELPAAVKHDTKWYK
jgi:hypothetical protein